MEGFGNKLSPLHFLMSVMVVLRRSPPTLKLLQSSIVLTFSDSGIINNLGQSRDIKKEGKWLLVHFPTFLTFCVSQSSSTSFL